jgi:hypothetical protein
VAKKKQKPGKPVPKGKKKGAPAKSSAKAAVSKAGKKPAPTASGKRASWLDPKSHAPLIDQYARRLTSFMTAMADGKVDDSELDEQEARLVKLMKEIEPRLDGDLHGKVTQLLCELTAYDIMQMLHAMQAQRPQTVFRG